MVEFNGVSPNSFMFLILQVEHIVGIELAYINTKHPDFHEAQMIHKAVTNDQDGIRQLQKEIMHTNKQNMEEKENRVSIQNVKLEPQLLVP